MDDKTKPLSDAAREEQRRYKREYMRKWRAENPDKVAKNTLAYWERRAKRRFEVNDEQTERN